MKPTDNRPVRRSVPILIEAKSFIDITPYMRRITFQSDALHNAPADCAAAHIKVFLPAAGQQEPTLPTLGENGPIWPEGQAKPIVRTYTVRNIRPQQKEIDIEFVLHQNQSNGDTSHVSPAADFAQNVRTGQKIGITFPSNKGAILPQADNYYLIGDNTAFPAIAAMLEAMPATANAQVFLRVDTPREKIAFNSAANVQIQWFVADALDVDPMIKAFTSLNLPKDNVYFWLAGEDRMVVELRRYLRREQAYSWEQLYAVPYWRKGDSEEQYHKARHKVMDELD